MATADRALLDLKFKNLPELRKALDNKQRALKEDQGNAFHKSVIVMDRWIQKNFQQEGSLAYPGSGWKPLAASTIRARLGERRVKAAAKVKGKEVKDSTLKILQNRGWLRSKWKHFWNKSSAIIQSAVDYGIYHDSDKPRKRLPERKILPTEKQIMPELLKIFRTHIKTSLSRK